MVHTEHGILMTDQLSLSWNPSLCRSHKKMVFIFICHLQPDPKYRHNTLILNQLHGCR